MLGNKFIQQHCAMNKHRSKNYLYTPEIPYNGMNLLMIGLRIQFVIDVSPKVTRNSRVRSLRITRYKQLDQMVLENANLKKKLTKRKRLPQQLQQQSVDDVRWKAINVVIEVPEKLTPRGKGKELCVPLPLVTKPLHWASYNPTYVRNMEYMPAVQSSPNKQRQRPVRTSSVSNTNQSTHIEFRPQQIFDSTFSIATIHTDFTQKRMVAYLLIVRRGVYPCHFIHSIHCNTATWAAGNKRPINDEIDTGSGTRQQQEYKPEHSPLMIYS